MAEEFKKYVDVFLSIDPAPAAASSNGNVAVRTWRHAGDTYLLAVNCTDSPQTAKLKLRERVGKVVAADFGAAPKVDGTTIDVAFGPIDYVMLRFSAR